MLFVGSHFADSQLMRLSADASHDSPTLTVLDAVPNLAPIIDFCLVDPEKQGQSQIVSCSGAHKDGSLRIIKNGIGIEEMGELSDVQGVTGIWSLRPTFDALHDSILVFSFVAETRFQKLQGGSLEEMEDMGGFISQEPTLCCANVLGNAFVQVTPSTVRLIKGSKDGSSYTVLHSWSPSPNANSHGTTSICCAAVNPTQVVVGLTLGLLVYLKLSGAKITQVGKRQLENEASCIDISPLGTGTMEAAFCALGTWTDVAVRLFALPSLEDVDVKQIEGGKYFIHYIILFCIPILTKFVDVVPRSILMAQMNSSVFLMTGLGDGHMASYNMDPSSGKLSVAKKFTIGAQQVRLHQLWQDGKVVVFACADHPTVIHADGDHLRFANVNIKVTQICTVYLSIAHLYTVMQTGTIVRFHVQHGRDTKRIGICCKRRT